jgi:hypothetical protein
VLWLIAGISGLFYALLLALATVPGLPIGFALFGRKHAGGWIAGILFGYATTSLIWWAVVFTHAPSTTAFVGTWTLACAVASVLSTRVPAPLIRLPEWRSVDTTALVVLLLLVPILVGRPFAKLGSKDAEGNRLYRAYFIADFVWHTALTAELAKETQPPRNPFLASQPIHYYWTYFRVPATLAAHTGIDVQTALKLNAVGTALLFVSAVYLAAWAALPGWPLVTAAAVALTILAPSIEGLASIVDLLRRGHSLSELRDLNIDAIASWAFKGLRIDDLPRAMWYTPQHSMSCALGLLAVPVAIVGGVRSPPLAILLAGIALGASLAFNPLLGVVFCAVYGLTILVDGLRQRATFYELLRHGIAVLPVVIAFAWCQLNQVGEGAVSSLHFGFWGPARNATLVTFLLSFGPLLIPVAIALWPGRAEPFAPLWPALFGIVLGLLLMHLVTLTVDQAWVGFRGGQIVFVLAPALVARGFTRLVNAGLRREAIFIGLLVALLGLPTTVIDAYNAQDVTNFNMSPGNEFHWTVTITAAESEALDWIRVHTPPEAIVQHEPRARGRETWSLIPTFAERRMATGNALPLLPVPDYAEKNRQVQEIYKSDDAKIAGELARQLSIDYLYVGAAERRAYPAVAKFDMHPEYFTPVFTNAEVKVYRVK